MKIIMLFLVVKQSKHNTLQSMQRYPFFFLLLFFHFNIDLDIIQKIQWCVCSCLQIAFNAFTQQKQFNKDKQFVQKNKTKNKMVR